MIVIDCCEVHDDGGVCWYNLNNRSVIINALYL
jgi:hypothetical protein